MLTEKFMLRKIRNASRLSPADWSLILQAWFWLLFFDISLRMRPFHELQIFAARTKPKSASLPERTEALIPMLIAAVDHARYNHLYAMTCLRRALALQKMLALRGAEVDLKIGVRKDDGILSAHAWLEYQGRPLGEPERITERFANMQNTITH